MGRGCDVSGRPQTERTRIIVFCVDICCVYCAVQSERPFYCPKGHAAAVEKPDVSGTQRLSINFYAYCLWICGARDAPRVSFVPNARLCGCWFSLVLRIWIFPSDIRTHTWRKEEFPKGFSDVAPAESETKVLFSKIQGANPLLSSLLSHCERANSRKWITVCALALFLADAAQGVGCVFFAPVPLDSEGRKSAICAPPRALYIASDFLASANTRAAQIAARVGFNNFVSLCVRECVLKSEFTRAFVAITTLLSLFKPFPPTHPLLP